MRKSLLGVAAASGAAAMLGLTTTPAATAATFRAPVRVSTIAATEPGIEAAPDGTLYVHGPRGLGGTSYLWRSTDGGSTWVLTSNTFRITAPGGGDSDVSVAPDTGYLAWTDLSLASAGVGRSTDKGDTWIAQPLNTPVEDRQWVAAVAGGISYHVTHQIESGLVVGKSVDGGITYPVQSIAASALDQQNCLCPPGGLIAESGGGTGGLNDKVGVIFTTATGVRFAKSLNGGATWGKSIIDSQGGGSTLDAFPMVANAGGGVLHATWLEVNGNSTRVGYSKSTDWGSTWSPATWIVTTGTSVFPAVDAKGSKVSVALYHTANTGNPNSVPSSSQWFVKYLDSTNGGSTWSALTTADATAAKTGVVCTNGLGCGGGREFGDFLGVALDPSGKANISYDRVVGSDIDVWTVREA